jgi:EF-P beta-lysylation protein EpmB
VRDDNPKPNPACRPLRAGDWQRAWREAFTEPRALLDFLGLRELAARLPPEPPHGFPMRVPRAYAAKMRPRDPDDPLLRQVLPLDLELLTVEGFVRDAVGDRDARRGAGVLMKYEGRALLVATGACAVHCRYCFRRHFPYAEETAAAERFRPALARLREQRGLRELILSGGDPLALSTSKLEELSRELPTLPDLRILRIHTRIPVVLPERVDEELCAWLERLPLRRVVVLHANHPRELDAGVARACRDLAAAGCLLLNQSVLLAGVNDRIEVLAELSEALFDCGVLPYYLHQLDRVQGTAHFAVEDERARRIHRGLAARLPGYLVPRLVREIAGAPAKMPV